MRKDIEQRVEQFKKIRMELLEYIQDVSAKQKEERLFDKWNLKDVLAHLSAWDVQNVEDLDEMLKSHETPWIPNFDSYNEHSVEEAAEMTYDEVLEDFIESGALFIEAYKTLPQEVVAVHLWHGHEHTPLSLLAENISHYQNHLAEIKKVLASSTN